MKKDVSGPDITSGSRKSNKHPDNEKCFRTRYRGGRRPGSYRPRQKEASFFRRGVPLSWTPYSPPFSPTTAGLGGEQLPFSRPTPRPQPACFVPPAGSTLCVDTLFPASFHQKQAGSQSRGSGLPGVNRAQQRRSLRVAESGWKAARKLSDGPDGRIEKRPAVKAGRLALRGGGKTSGFSDDRRDQDFGTAGVQ